MTNNVNSASHLEETMLVYCLNGENINSATQSYYKSTHYESLITFIIQHMWL